MMNDTREAHVELLLGRLVYDERGKRVGRIEEMIVEIVDGEPVVTEFHIGAGALLERIAGFVSQLPFFGWLSSGRVVRVPWRDMDLSNVDRPRARLRE